MGKTVVLAEVKKVRRLEDITIVADGPSWIRYWGNLERRAKELESWVKEFHDFIRDHRSQDPVTLNVEREYKNVCSGCGCEWEPDTDEDGTFCAGCGARVADMVEA